MRRYYEGVHFKCGIPNQEKYHLRDKYYLKDCRIDRLKKRAKIIINERKSNRLEKRLRMDESDLLLNKS